jgi:hypothetical protein
MGSPKFFACGCQWCRGPGGPVVAGPWFLVVGLEVPTLRISNAYIAAHPMVRQCVSARPCVLSHTAPMNLQVLKLNFESAEHHESLDHTRRSREDGPADAPGP